MPLRLLLGAALAFALILTAAGRANATPADDQAITDTLQQAMTEDYPGSLGPAKKKLEGALAQCVKKSCNPAIKAQLYVALGMVASQTGNADEAKGNFDTALKTDPGAKLPAAGTTPAIKQQFADAQKGNGGADDTAGAEAPGAAPDGWRSAEAFKLASEAADASQAADSAHPQKLDECIDKAKASLTKEEQPRTRLLIASCEARAGKLVDALKDSRKALEAGLARKDPKVTKAATRRVQELNERIPHVTFAPPTGVDNLQVTFDERPVPNESLTKRFSVDPGKHSVRAEGTVNGLPSSYEEEIQIAEKETFTVRITLKPKDSGVVTAGQIKCMLAAKTQEDVQKCLPQNQKNLVVRIGTDVSAYTDSLSVNVISPGVNASLVSPTAGWNVGGHYILDVLSAASPDIVSTASPPFKETRHAGGLTGGYKPGLYGVQGVFNISREPDYLSLTGGLAVTADLHDKLITPRLAYSLTNDTIARGPGNPLGDITDLKGTLNSHSFDAGVTFVLSPTSVLLVGGSAQFERGDQSKPYRYVPLFDPNVASLVPVGATVDLVNQNRLAIRPTEQLPTERNRYAIGARYNHRIGTSSTLRLEERLYFDSWASKATTTDARYMVDLSKHLRVWPHGRFHFQTATNFYQLAYSAITDQATGTLIVPTYRTGDRELSPMLTLTAGGGTRLSLGNQEGEVKYGITLSGDVMYSRFLNSLFVTTRIAMYSTLAFDVEF